jgi:protein-disulfide isomerase
MRPVAAVICLSAALIAQAQSTNTTSAHVSAPAIDKKALEEYVRHLFLWDSRIQIQIADPKPSEIPGFFDVAVTASNGSASQSETYLVSKDGRKIIRGTVYDISRDPFAADREKLHTDAAPSLGPADAPVQIVLFSDFQCSYCRQEAKVIREQLIPAFGKDVHLTFKDYPLEAIHPWAKTAAIAGRCVWRQKPEAFWTFHDWIFQHQDEITPDNLKTKVLEFAANNRLEPIQFADCIDNKATAGEVERSIAEGRALNLNSTPTLFINGRRLVGAISWEQLGPSVQYERDYARTHPRAEACCEVKLPGGGLK